MNIFANCSALSGVAISDTECLVSLMNDGLSEARTQHSIPLVYKVGLWSFVSDEPILPWITADTARIGQNSQELLVVGWAGQVLLIDDAGTRREAIFRTDSLPVSIIRSASAIGQVVYAAGMGRQVYRRTIESGWTPIDGAVVSSNGESHVGFEAIGGFERGEIYAAGLNGELWTYVGTAWHKIDSPANVHLHSICCAEDGFVYIGGRTGVLIKGREHSWQVIDLGIDAPVWDMQWFNRTLYLIIDDGIYQYSDGVAEKVAASNAQGEFVNFSCSENRMWAFGRKKIAWFDGSGWSEHPADISEENLNRDLMSFLNDEVLISGSPFLTE